MELKYLTELVDAEMIERMTAPHARTLIVAGVGAGKTTLIEDLAKKIHKDNGKRTLAITSRTAKRLQMSAEKLDYMVLTNAGISKLMGELGALDELRECVGCIILDEAHSMVTDCTFTSNHFHMRNFFEELASLPIILMTATPNLLGLNHWYTEQGFEVLNFIGEAKNVLPRSIELIDRHQATALVRGAKDKFFYYVNDIDRLERLYKLDAATSVLILSGLVYDINKGYLITGNSRMGRLPKKMAEKGLRAYENIIETNKLAGRYKRFYCTSVLREGIDIKYSNGLRFAIIESSDLDEIYQFAGRFRFGLDKLYVVPNNRSRSKQFIEKFEKKIRAYSSIEMNDGTFYFFQQEACISRDEAKAFYLSRDNKFMMLDIGKLDYYKYQRERSEEFEEDPEKHLKEYFGDSVEIVNRIGTSEEVSSESIDCKRIEDFVEQDAWVSRDEQDEILRTLTDNGFLNNKGDPYRYLGDLLVANGWVLKNRLRKKTNGVEKGSAKWVKKKIN